MTIAMIQARMSSSRLPGKVLKNLAGIPALKHVVDRAQNISGISRVVVLTSNQVDDDLIKKWCQEHNTDVFRGDLNDVLKRFYDAATHYQASSIMRLTADCPLLDPHVAGEVLALFKATAVDYCSNVVPPTWPDGLDCEVFSFAALEQAYKEATSPADREHVTRYIRNNRSIFKVRNLTCPIPGLQHYRWTLDTEADHAFLEKLLTQYPHPKGYLDILNILADNPDLRNANIQNETTRTFIKSTQARNFTKSKNILERAEKSIPLGSQTFSKSKMICNPGHAPLFATHALGGKIWDVDGNDYVDMVMGLLPVVLGYNDPDTNQAIRSQLDNGITLSLATELEYQLAERIADFVPCAEKTRFCKNGSDATSAAIRLARAFTGRDHIIVCGYHGWQDWYIGSTTRHKGVPDIIRGLTHKVDYNDLDAVSELLRKNKGQIAALIMEPMNVTLPKPGYLQQLKELLHANGALLIFDEVITGFRFAKGGAQEYLGVTPDLAAFGKGLGNGMPIAAITGRADIMEEMNHIFFSGTFGGEALSLAASIAVLDKMQREPVIETLWQTGTLIKTQVDNIIKSNGLNEIISFAGVSPWHLLQFKNNGAIPAAAIKTFLLHELFQQGVLSFGAHNICYAHSQSDVQTIIGAYEYVAEKISTLMKQNRLLDHMPYPVLTPVFEVRRSA